MGKTWVDSAGRDAENGELDGAVRNGDGDGDDDGVDNDDGHDNDNDDDDDENDEQAV